MNRLSQRIAAAVDARVDSEPGLITVESENHRLIMHVVAAGPVGLAFDSLEYALIDHAPLTHPQLKSWADRLVTRLTYLMEPLVVLEIDAAGGQAELRSEAPSWRDGRRTYYELRLDRRAALRLSRVTFDEASRKRDTALCQLTREALERLADDLVESLD